MTYGVRTARTARVNATLELFKLLPGVWWPTVFLSTFVEFVELFHARARALGEASAAHLPLRSCARSPAFGWVWIRAQLLSPPGEQATKATWPGSGLPDRAGLGLFAALLSCVEAQAEARAVISDPCCTASA